MSSYVDNMIRQFDCKTKEDVKKAIAASVQELILAGMSKGGFFKEGTACGGTILRIFYDLPRFSEDIDLMLDEPDTSFLLTDYSEAVIGELKKYGINAEVTHVTMGRTVQAEIVSGLIYDVVTDTSYGFHPSEKFKIKVEVDTNPPEGCVSETKYMKRPGFMAVRIYDEGSLFAGKIGAVLMRDWGDRVKGRDLYDYQWYIMRDTPVNMPFLESNLRQQGFIANDVAFDERMLKDMLKAKFSSLDYDKARDDLQSFVSAEDAEQAKMWNADFFCTITDDYLHVPTKSDGIDTVKLDI